MPNPICRVLLKGQINPREMEVFSQNGETGLAFTPEDLGYSIVRVSRIEYGWHQEGMQLDIAYARLQPVEQRKKGW